MKTWQETVMSDEQVDKIVTSFHLPPQKATVVGDIVGQLKQLQAEITWAIAFKAGLKEAGLQLRARIGGVEEFADWSDEGLRLFRKMALQAIKDLLKEWGLE